MTAVDGNTVTIAPDFTVAEMTVFVKDLWALDAQITLLYSERDQNALVEVQGGQKYILKISNTAEHPGFLRAQHRVLDHCARVDAGLCLPCVHTGPNHVDIFYVDSPRSGARHLARLLTYVDGTLFTEAAKTQTLYASAGTYLGKLTTALQGCVEAEAIRDDFIWNLDNARAVKPYIRDIQGVDHRALVQGIFTRYEQSVWPRLQKCRKSLLYQDANDRNILVQDGLVSGVIDFGDICVGHTVNDLAIMLAYMLMDTDDPLGTARQVISAYVAEFPLAEHELDLLFDLVLMRLVTSVCISSHRAHEAQDNAYLLVSQKPAFELLQKLMVYTPEFLTAYARWCGGMSPVSGADRVQAWLRRQKAAPVVKGGLHHTRRMAVSMAAGAPGTDLVHDQQAYAAWLNGEMQTTGAEIAFGSYMEDRTCYTQDQFKVAGSESRSMHLGIDVFAPAGTTVHTPFDGTLHSFQDNAYALDYGPTIIVEHKTDCGTPFYTLYGHLSRESLTGLKVGQHVQAGEQIATFGTIEENGGWAPHLHFQVMTAMLGEVGNFHGACQPSQEDMWRVITPDPNLILGLAPESFTAPADAEKLIARRRRYIGKSLSLGYQTPLHIIRGAGVYLYDDTGRAYLDCVNNISHVGHANRRVVEAIAAQASRLNTNTRYLHETILAYSERLLATLPDAFDRIFYVCSGSEANELALRMAKAYSGRDQIIALDWAYHGNTENLVAISPYKFNRAGGHAQRPHVHIADLPAGRNACDGEQALRSLSQQIKAANEQGGAACFIAEPISGCGGQVVFPDGYLRSAFDQIRGAGGVAICDEVQVGFGRVGPAFWSFADQGAIPDIVTMGKPMGNGHPVAAVATTAAIADAFAGGMEYFNSFGGNPVSLAAATAVLDEIQGRGLAENAAHIGQYCISQLEKLMHRHDRITDVRGRGLYIGVELMENGQPATGLATQAINRAKDAHAVLLSTDGPYGNVLKIKPPVIFDRTHADYMVAAIDAALTELC